MNEPSQAYLEKARQSLSEGLRSEFASTGLPAILVKIAPKYLYKIFYRVDREVIDILHIRHASRRPWIA
jgi:plasmid stabilization system protein ParE